MSEPFTPDLVERACRRVWDDVRAVESMAQMVGSGTEALRQDVARQRAEAVRRIDAQIMAQVYGDLLTDGASK